MVSLNCLFGICFLLPIPVPPGACPGRSLVRDPFPAAPPRTSRPFPSSPLRRAEKWGRSTPPAPPSSRFSAGPSFPCDEAEDVKPPPSQACSHPRCPALREDAVESSYRPFPTLANRVTPQLGFSLFLPYGRSFPSSTGRRGFGPSSPSRFSSVRSWESLTWPNSPCRRCVRAVPPPTTCVPPGTPTATPLPAGFPSILLTEGSPPSSPSPHRCCSGKAPLYLSAGRPWQREPAPLSCPWRSLRAGGSGPASPLPSSLAGGAGAPHLP